MAVALDLGAFFVTVLQPLKSIASTLEKTVGSPPPAVCRAPQTWGLGKEWPDCSAIAQEASRAFATLGPRFRCLPTS